MSLSEEDMKRIAAILLSITVLLVHPAATALGQEPNIAIPAGAVVAGSGLDTGQSEGKAEGQETGLQIGDTMAVEAPAGIHSRLPRTPRRRSRSRRPRPC